MLLLSSPNNPICEKFNLEYMKLEEIIRNEQNQITVPIITLKRGERSIILIGMIHVASEVFFKTVVSTLNKCEEAGFQILYEEVEGIPSAEKQTLDLLFNGLQKYGLYSQLDFLQPHDSWKSADLSQAMDINFDNGSSHEENDDDDMRSPEKYIRNILLPQLENPSMEIPDFEMIINQRNEFAVRAILECAEKEGIATFWGCSHLPGMINLLEQAGFQIDKMEWINALNIGNLKSQLQIATKI